MKVTDKKTGNSVFLDPEGNLDLPEVSHVATIYGVYNFNHKHSIEFSFFGINRESSIFSFDKTFEDVRVVGDATISLILQISIGLIMVIPCLMMTVVRLNSLLVFIVLILNMFLRLKEISR